MEFCDRRIHAWAQDLKFFRSLLCLSAALTQSLTRYAYIELMELMNQVWKCHCCRRLRLLVARRLRNTTGGHRFYPHEKGVYGSTESGVVCSRDGQDLTSARRPGIRRSHCRIRPTASQIPGFPPFRPGVDGR